MSDMSLKSFSNGNPSTPTSASTLVPPIDAKELFNGVVAGINLRSAPGGASVRIEKTNSVSKIIDTVGPKAILGGEHFQLRWIHLPVNSMAWIEELMEKLEQEKLAQADEDEQDSNDNPVSGGILRDDVWKHAFHGRHSAGVHSRFMRPICARYSSADPDDAESDDSDTMHHNSNILALHMPYLHWETYSSWKDRQRHIAHMKDLAEKNSQCQCLHHHKDIFDAHAHKNEILLHEQLFLQRPLHDRRTLDQSYFYNLRKVAYRDDDQVIGQHTLRYAGEQRDKQRKMMMVDQLWMWVIDGNTIVTSFPETTIPGQRNDADVLDKILSDLKPALGEHVKSLNGLLVLIINTCSSVFHRRDISADLAFFEFFADEIGTAKSEVEDSYRSFYQTSQSIETLWRDPTVSSTSMTAELDSLFSIKHELKLLQRVEAILSDLRKIDFLCSQQSDVVHALAQSNSTSSSSHNRTSHTLTALLSAAQHRRRLWADMSESATATQLSLQSLLDLKQRQAAVSEARTVRYQVEISSRQGRSIMLLTVVTIVFLPVSVVAAVFSMNAWELNAGKLHLSTEVMIMAPVTAGVVFVALAVAFWEVVRDLVVWGVRRVPL